MLAINQFVENFSKKYSKQIAISKATSLWQEIIPSHLKKITFAKKIKNETLQVSLKENEWLFPLTENRQHLIKKINDKIKKLKLEVNIKEIYFYYDENFPLEENKEILEKFLFKKKQAVSEVTKNKVNNDSIIESNIQQLKNYYELYFDWQKKYRDKFGEQNQQKIETKENSYFYLEDQINSFFLNHNDGIDYFDNLNELKKYY